MKWNGAINASFFVNVRFNVRIIRLNKSNNENKIKILKISFSENQFDVKLSIF